MITGKVFDIKKFSIHDGPGIRTTVFFKGCPLSCRWCHNPESQALEPEMMLWANRCIRCEACLPVCKQGAISRDGDFAPTDGEKCVLCGACVEACHAGAREIVGREMTVAQVMAEIERDVAFYDESNGGVTFSGGEPLWQAGFLLALLQACQEKEIHTALDTCGFAPWEMLDAIREHVDLFMYDLKLMDDAKHRDFTGVSNELILKNLQALSQRGHDIVLRVPIVRLLYERGRFGPDDTAATATALFLYAFGLVGYTAVKVLAPAFYALDRPRLPLLASVLSVNEPSRAPISPTLAAVASATGGADRA